MLNQNDHTAHYRKVHEYLNRFVPLTDEEFEFLVPFWKIRHFNKKKRIVDVGEVENYFNIILKGLARKYVVTGKKEVTQQLAVEEDVLYSEISFHTRTPSPVIIEAIEPTILISISYEDAEQIYLKMPKAERLGRLILSDRFIKQDERDFTYLNKTTRERFMDFVETQAHMLQRVPQKYIASYLNIKPETFSRLKHLLRKKR